MLRWTDWVIHHRKRVIGAWLVVFLLGAAAASNLGSLLTNRFSVPGSDAERGLNITKQRFHERGQGAFTLVVVPKAATTVTDAGFRAAAQQAAQRAAAVLKGGMAVPIVFALISIPTTLGFVWIFANFIDMAIYVQNIVTLIGFAIAVDYSMLVVFRFREELERHDNAHDALRTTMATAGRATLFSGATVAVGLALLVLMPLPFMRSMGIGGLLVPLVSMAASATLLPALLAVMGRRINRFRFVPRAVLARPAEAP